MFRALGINNPQRFFLRIILLLAALLFIALAYNPLEHFYADVFMSLRLQLLSAALVCALLLITLKLFKLGAALLLVCIVGVTPVLFNLSSSTSYSGPVLSVKQINLNYSNKYIETHLATLLQKKWDVLILQEFSDKNRNLLNQFLSTTDMFGYEEIEGIPYGIVVLSRIPMVYKHQVKLDADRLGYIKLKFLFIDRIVTVFVAHPPSPRSRQHWQNRNTLLAALNTAAHNEKGVWVIAGDLNIVPWSQYFNWDDSKTCYGESERYVSFMPFERGRSIFTGLAIDHCIMSEGINLQRLTASDFKGSDHRMLSYDLIID
ncbi:endonuclease/exonuclease/phosphatase family protein [Pseudoalteromonas sp. 1_2015MBL_MicDiv]|uniref:endonuclease/exonuclease/phosphatase family protein n=1 Tax=Pseudoalteromonas sp. 1_2015MBL_MicDiv TaxID=1720343 RepID=UPI000BBF1414|nr:endonuclease/exonuclease/phosphatase family protein [Pseudoalteromonas sp. 1_2015MBL_MicDiv]ATG77882.1 endonuclease [Pseudoalteromonas sp. 1_2015MBL_MicDiv]